MITVIASIALAFSLLGNPIKADKKADKHGKDPRKEGESTERFIEDSLEKILSSPKESSSPEDYINAHNDEYHDILKRGEHALNYLLGQFELGNIEGIRGEIMMSLAKELLGERDNITDNSLTPQDWYQALEIRKEVSIPDFKYEGGAPIEKLVYETEMGRDSGISKMGGFLVIAPVIYGTYEEEDMLKVFLTTYSQAYKLYENTLTETGGSVIPVAITYKKDSNGEYIEEKYEQARDGSNFGPSIRDFSTMPKSNKEIKGLADKILNDYGSSKDMIQLMNSNLYNHLKKYGVTDAILRDPYGEIKFSMKDFK